MLTLKIYSPDDNDQDVWNTEIKEVQKVTLKEFLGGQKHIEAAEKYGTSKALWGILTIWYEIGDSVDSYDHYLYAGYKVFVENDSGKTTLAVRY